ncbi:EpsG family protein [Shinella zoogloeoides]|uniref:EpsG family protein n=1 Tax=Shinella zoogloeoides TaxID=352475 RepID=UPI001F5706D2|nr:EpsG family protein [Shinella zoogloeoides]
MITYYILYAIIALSALLGEKFLKHREKNFFILLVISLVLFVGLREEIGGDWGSYHEILNLASGASLGTALHILEPGYSLINWVGSNKFGGIYFPNFVCALLAIIPLSIFCRSRANPWLSLVVATPYLIIVVYMGYTRQSAAIGICMLAILSLEREHFWSAIGFVMLAALFHLTAAGFFLPTILLSSLPLNWRNALQAALMAAIAGTYVIILSAGRLNFLFGAYVSEAYVSTPDTNIMQSAGALPRLGLGFLAGAIFIWLVRQQTLLNSRNGIWTLSALGSFILLPLAFLTSTFADRLGLYFIPLQLHVANLVEAELKSFVAQQMFRIAVVGLYGAMLTVWLMRSRFAEYWLPYDNLLFHLF